MVFLVIPVMFKNINMFITGTLIAGIARLLQYVPHFLKDGR